MSQQNGTENMIAKVAAAHAEITAVEQALADRQLQESQALAEEIRAFVVKIYATESEEDVRVRQGVTKDAEKVANAWSAEFAKRRLYEMCERFVNTLSPHLEKMLAVLKHRRVWVAESEVHGAALKALNKEIGIISRAKHLLVAFPGIAVYLDKKPDSQPAQKMPKATPRTGKREQLYNEVTARIMAPTATA